MAYWQVLCQFQGGYLLLFFFFFGSAVECGCIVHLVAELNLLPATSQPNDLPVEHLCTKQHMIATIGGVDSSQLKTSQVRESKPLSSDS